MNIQELKNADLRRSILTLLAYDVDYQLNQTFISMALEAIGKSVTKDILDNQLLWLKIQNFVNIDENNNLRIVTLTDHGLEVAKGKARVHGVRDLRPSELSEIKQFKG